MNIQSIQSECNVHHESESEFHMMISFLNIESSDHMQVHESGSGSEHH